MKKRNFFQPFLLCYNSKFTFIPNDNHVTGVERTKNKSPAPKTQENFFQFHIQLLKRAFICYPFLSELNFTMCNPSRRLALSYFTDILFALLDNLVHWTTLSFLFLDVKPRRFFPSHLSDPPLLKCCKSILYVGINFTTSFNLDFSSYPYDPFRQLRWALVLPVHWCLLLFL